MAEKKTHAATARDPEITTPLTTLHTGHESIDKVAHPSGRLIDKFCAYPVVAHMIHAAERFAVLRRLSQRPGGWSHRWG